GLLSGAVLDDALVEIFPRALEQRPFGHHVRIGVEDQYLRTRLCLLEVARDLAGALIRARRTAVRRGRYRYHVDAAVSHRHQLAAQLYGLRPGLPGVQNASGAHRVRVALDFAEQEI